MAEVLDTEVVRDRGASPGPRERSPRPRREPGPWFFNSGADLGRLMRSSACVPLAVDLSDGHRLRSPSVGSGTFSALVRYLVLLTPTQRLCQLRVGCAWPTRQMLGASPGNF
jgi:hypothetical protein